MTGVISYFNQVKASFLNMDGIFKYQIGVYGNGDVCSTLLERDLVQFTWLSGSPSYYGSADFINYNISQEQSGKTLGDQAFDVDISIPDNFGSFHLPMVSIA